MIKLVALISRNSENRRACYRFIAYCTVMSRCVRELIRRKLSRSLLGYSNYPVDIFPATRDIIYPVLQDIAESRHVSSRYSSSYSNIASNMNIQFKRTFSTDLRTFAIKIRTNEIFHDERIQM